MDWINEPNETMLTTRDACVVHVCWARGSGGACDIRWCITRVCPKDY